MLFRALSAAVYGIDANLVDVEVDLTPARNEVDQTPAVIVVGLPDAAVRESRERIRAAINNSAFFFPPPKNTNNPAPGCCPKKGRLFCPAVCPGNPGPHGGPGNRQPPA